MSIEYRYFKVTGGAVRAALERWREMRKQQLAARKRVVLEYKASAVYGSPRGCEGLQFTSPNLAPEGWVKVRGGSGVFKPSGSSKEAKAARQKLSALKMADQTEFQAEVLGKDAPFHFMLGLKVYWMGFEFIGDVMILHVPKVPAPNKKNRTPEGMSEGYKWSPPDSETVELKASEYWQLKESAAEKSTAEPATH